MSDDWWKREATHLKARVTELEAERAKALRFRGERPDGTDRLALALYGRTAEPRDYLGGSQAVMLHEAAALIERLRTSRTELERLTALVAARDEALDLADEELTRLRALLAEPSEEEAERLNDILRKGERQEWQEWEDGDGDEPPRRWGVRAILADLRARAGGADAG